MSRFLFLILALLTFFATPMAEANTVPKIGDEPLITLADGEGEVEVELTNMVAGEIAVTEGKFKLVEKRECALSPQLECCAIQLRGRGNDLFLEPGYQCLVQEGVKRGDMVVVMAAHNVANEPLYAIVRPAPSTD